MSDGKVVLSTFFGVKAGMTRIFDESGNHIPVTVVKLIPNKISQVKTNDKDGYCAYQVAFNQKRETLINKASKGILAKAGISESLSLFAEIKASNTSSDAVGKSIDLSEFKPGSYVDVTGISKGKGFSGVMKRYNFAGGPASHGSHFHRRVGSIGNRATPARVFRGKKMPGHLGSESVTVQNVVIVEASLDKGYILLKGSVPGSKEGVIKISKAHKKQ